MIHLQDINKTYQGAQPLHVLKGISLDIAKGEFVSIMGASGSGKSTLLNILGILDNYDSGTYELAGVPILNLSERECRARSVIRWLWSIWSVSDCGIGQSITLMNCREDRNNAWQLPEHSSPVHRLSWPTNLRVHSTRRPLWR